MTSGKDIVNAAMSHYGGPAERPTPATPRRRSEVPGYAGLKILGWLQIILGFILLAVGTISILAVLVGSLVGEVAAAREGARTGGAGFLLGGGLSAGIAIVVFIAGITQIGYGQLLLAIRDMAQNSFWLRRM